MRFMPSPSRNSRSCLPSGPKTLAFISWLPSGLRKHREATTRISPSGSISILGKVAVNPNNCVSRDAECPETETIEEYSLSVWVFGKDAHSGRSSLATNASACPSLVRRRIASPSKPTEIEVVLNPSGRDNFRGGPEGCSSILLVAAAIWNVLRMFVYQRILPLGILGEVSLWRG